jgi:hypothetical protein
MDEYIAVGIDYLIYKADKAPAEPAQLVYSNSKFRVYKTGLSSGEEVAHLGSGRNGRLSAHASN